ncbi:hypothetical protein M422DRAFT_46191 [Sphaerobolus stellatus SS14]|nr:hypothetical protein M422DRAFT_46191 [Sphaerobolus stellatus SS14]
MSTVTLKRTGDKIPKAATANTIYTAIKLGYRLIDGACDYGNEIEAGQGVKRAIDEGIVKREDIFITTKVWNTFHRHEHVKEAAKLQLEHWGLDYFDLYLVHFPISLKYVDPKVRYPPEWHADEAKTICELEDVPLQETWKAVEELVDEGLVRNVGISNISGSLLVDVHTYARYQPQVLQIEHHPYLTQEPLVKYAREILGMAMTAYSSFGPQSFYEIGWGKGATSLMQHETITSIAQAHGKSQAQVLLRWSTQRGIAVLPKSTTESMLNENLQSTKFDLTADELVTISGLNLNLRFNNPAAIDPRFAIFA